MPVLQENIHSCSMPFDFILCLRISLNEAEIRVSIDQNDFIQFLSYSYVATRKSNQVFIRICNMKGESVRQLVHIDLSNA